MKLDLQFSNPFWWLWFVTLALILSAVAGWTLGYFLVIGISALQILIFLVREGSLSAFPVQVRLVYFAWTLLGLWPTGRLVAYLLLFVGTFMAVFFNRCSISMLLKGAPWNRGRAPRLY